MANGAPRIAFRERTAHPMEMPGFGGWGGGREDRVNKFAGPVEPHQCVFGARPVRFRIAGIGPASIANVGERHRIARAETPVCGLSPERFWPTGDIQVRQTRNPPVVHRPSKGGVALRLSVGEQTR